MTKTMQKAIILKDLRTIATNKRMLAVLLIVPLIMMVVVPTIIVLTLSLAPLNSPDFQELAGMLLPGAQGDLRQMLLNLLFNNVLPLFFLIIPVMASSVMAAGAFIGEKEKSTLETLLYCPLSLKRIFNSKVLSSFLLSTAVSLLSFFVMLLVVEIEVFIVSKKFLLPGISWLVMMLLVSPAISLIAITLIVRGSAKAQSFEESQQRSVFLILPILLLLVGQFTGIMAINAWVFLGMGVVCALLAWLLLKSAFRRFSYETLLQ